MSGTVGGAIGAGSTTTLTDATIRNIIKGEKTSSHDPSVNVEKGEVTTVEDEDQIIPILYHDEQFPIDPDEELETQQFTVRAVLVGCLLGGVIAASKYVARSFPRTTSIDYVLAFTLV